MKILFTAPFWSPEVNSISRAAIYLGNIGHNILIITSQSTDSLKGKVSAPPIEIIGNTEFYRPYADKIELTWHPRSRWNEIHKKVVEFAPDVIIGFGDPFFRLPLLIHSSIKVPLVMFF